MSPVSTARHVQLFTVALILLVVRPAIPGAVADDDDQNSVQDSLETLRNGSPRERLKAADDAAMSIGFGIIGMESEQLDGIVDELALLLQQEREEWIARTLLDSVQWDHRRELNALFRWALKSNSVNLQAIAVKHFTTVEDPEAVEPLEALWARHPPEWVRPRLIEALAEQGSTRQLADFTRVARGGEPESRRAAIDALGTLADDQALPVLIRLARDGEIDDRWAATRALESYADSDEAFETVLRASQSPDSPTFGAAVCALGSFGRPDGDARLIALLEETASLDARDTVVQALAASGHPDATHALVRLLHEPEITSDSLIIWTILSVLRGRNDPAAIPGLQDLVGKLNSGTFDPIVSLVASLSRNRSRGRAASQGCYADLPEGSSKKDAWHVKPSQSFMTIRCWDGPDWPGDPKRQTRIPGGTEIDISDHFEGAREHWVEVVGDEVDDCWVPLSQLENGPASYSPPTSEGRVRHEFDLPVLQLDSIRGIRLEESGLLEVFDPGAEISGAALEVDPCDAQEIALLLALLERNHTPLDDAIRRVLKEVDAIDASDASTDEVDEDASEEDE